MKYKPKVGVLSYSNSNNLGDYIQAIAAKEMLKSKFEELDRDNLSSYNEFTIKLLMNGWFMENANNWPPSKHIIPFFISFHLNPSVKSKMLNPLGVRYLKTFEPIGCRDLYTKKTLEEKGIKSFFSGCLTLCLDKKKLNLKKTNRKGIVVISALDRIIPEFKFFKNPGVETMITDLIKLIKYPKRLIDFKKSKIKLDVFLKKQTEEVSCKSQIIDIKKVNLKDREKLAYKQLGDIANAKLLITSRIHSALPAVAFGTPVLFLSDGLNHINQKSRLDGLEIFFKISDTENLKEFSLEDIQLKKAHYPFVDLLKNKIDFFFN
jgi:hypothetical protein